MSSAIIFIPASALILVLIFGRLLGNKGIALVLTASLFIARLLTGLLFFDIGINQSIVEINLLSWVSDIYFLID
jgi:general stress protein CsbA